ncbi:hypothetical protein E2C01_085214 [Portunus trituberculatus]|uniref:Uncharacterized protein n=1 Tax=Portunus trituberculatus TaxID=210409 RepID=A0A5B7JBB5_PORTR|nr:hypothetical protein [Portunus trituberculatus]
MNTQSSRFDRLTRQFNIHYLACHPLCQIYCHPKFTTSPPGGSVNRRGSISSYASLSPQPSSRQAMLCRSTSCLHAASTMPHKATSNPSPKRHNFLPFKDKLELIRKYEAGIAQCRCSANGCP